MATISSARPSWQRSPVFKFFASLKLAVVLLAVLIVAAIAGTIWESSFDAKVARAYVYRAPWFNLWLILLGANLTVSAFSRWPWRKHHVAFLVTHLVIITLLTGSLIGRIFGIEGTMTLFKGDPPSNRGMSGTASNAWEQTKEKAGAARERTEIFVRSNPIPILLSALGIGIAIGLAIRYASSTAERKIEAEEKIGDGALGLLSLPFLWPMLKSVKAKAEDSADALKEGVDRLKNVKVSHYTKPIRKRWKAWTR